MPTPKEEADRLGVPLIPKLPESEPAGMPSDPNRTVAICGECGLRLKRVMAYACPRARCPSGLGGGGTVR